MKKLTQLQYEVIFLYSKGLTFKEIDFLLKTSSKGFYNQAKTKDKGRVTRAKLSREKNIDRYKKELLNYIDEVKTNNKRYKNCTQWVKDNYILSVEVAKEKFREKYLIDCLNKFHKSYTKYKITFLKNIDKKIA